MENEFIYLDDAAYSRFIFSKRFRRLFKKRTDWMVGCARHLLTPEAYEECLALREADEKPPLTYEEALVEVLDNVESTCEEVSEGAYKAFHNSIDRWSKDNARCYMGLNLDYVDNELFVERVASKCRSYLRVLGECL